MIASYIRDILLLSSLVQAAIIPADPSKNISWPFHRFKTVDFAPPVVNFSHHTASSEGYLFFAPDGATEVQLAPLIVDASGELIWNGPMEHAFNFGKQTYKGEEVLVWWNGTLYPEPIGRGNGAIYLYDNHYNEIHRTTLPGNFHEQVPGATFPTNIDLHELYLTENGTVLVTANNVTTADLSSVGGPVDGWVVDCLVYEIDIATNEVLFHWSALDHLDQLPFSDSCYPIGSEGYTGADQAHAWGYFHINAAQPYEDGYILSARYLCSAIAISKTGHVRWRLDGRHGGSFKLAGQHADFRYQHDIRVVSERKEGVTLRMHDNHNSPIDNGSVPTSAKILDLDFKSKTATLKHRFFNDSGPIYSTAQGNALRLLNGNLFVGHGFIPVLEEFAPSGEILSTFQFGAAEARPSGGYFSQSAPTLSYRAFKQKWEGCPTTKPDVAAEKCTNGKMMVYVSWNGATDVERWEIWSGQSTHGLEKSVTIARNGFETSAELERTSVVQVKPILKARSNCESHSSSVVDVK